MMYYVLCEKWQLFRLLEKALESLHILVGKHTLLFVTVHIDISPVDIFHTQN